jgi:hypothetical protein
VFLAAEMSWQWPEEGSFRHRVQAGTPARLPPNTWIDITEHDMKIEALKAHASQLEGWDLSRIREWGKSEAEGSANERPSGRARIPIAPARPNTRKAFESSGFAKGRSPPKHNSRRMERG